MVNPGWADLDRGLFSISVAAELAGLHPQTLRIYEREGLLDPARSAGGTRRYSRRDIDRLQQICALTADGLNLAGIRRVLQLQEETRQLQAELARLRLGVECKFQGTTGTAEEKIPAIVGDIDAWPIRGIVVISGKGFSPNMRYFLISSGKAVDVEDLEDWLRLYFGLTLETFSQARLLVAEGKLEYRTG